MKEHSKQAFNYMVIFLVFLPDLFYQILSIVFSVFENDFRKKKHIVVLLLLVVTAFVLILNH